MSDVDEILHGSHFKRDTTKKKHMGFRAHVYPTPTTQKPPQIRNFGNFGPIWMKLGREVYFRESSSIPAYGMARGTFSPPQPPKNHPSDKLLQFLSNSDETWWEGLI